MGLQLTIHPLWDSTWTSCKQGKRPTHSIILCPAPNTSHFVSTRLLAWNTAESWMSHLVRSLTAPLWPQKYSLLYQGISVWGTTARKYNLQWAMQHNHIPSDHYHNSCCSYNKEYQPWSAHEQAPQLKEHKLQGASQPDLQPLVCIASPTAMLAHNPWSPQNQQ